MKEILLSIKPVYASLILEGLKWWEFRKKAPCVAPSTRVYIYATFPVSKIVGYFTLGDVIGGDVANIYQRTYMHACLSLITLQKYALGYSRIYAWQVVCPRRFDTPKTLEEFGLKRPPQSYCYIYK